MSSNNTPEEQTNASSGSESSDPSAEGRSVSSARRLIDRTNVWGLVAISSPLIAVACHVLAANTVPQFIASVTEPMVLTVFAAATLAGGSIAMVMSTLASAFRDRDREAEQFAEQKTLLERQLREELDRAEELDRDLAAANLRLESNQATFQQWTTELEAANEKLRELDQIKTKFFSEVSHELRGPVAAMVSAAKIITKHHRTKPEVVLRFGGTIVDEGDRLTRLINDFLDLAKIESGCTDWRQEQTKASDLVIGASKAAEPLALDRGIFLEHELGDCKIPMLVDPDRIKQVLTNMINNAIKHTPEGGTVTIAVDHRESEYIFAVGDTGPGIPPEQAERVFSRYHQVKNSMDGEKVSGTGLGLCISKEIVEHYEGSIWVESEVGRGSVFYFTIPDAATMDQPQLMPSTAALSLRELRVVIFTNNQVLAGRALDMPIGSGIECRTRDTVEGLKDALTSWEPDCVVLDDQSLSATEADVEAMLRDIGMANVLAFDGQTIRPHMTEPGSAIVARRMCSTSPRGSKILVVDDDEHYAALLEHELKHYGYEVVTALTGEEAIEVIENEEPDAVVLDIILPKLDGLGVLGRVKMMPYPIPVIVLTGMEDAGVASAATELGATDVIYKNGMGDVTRAAMASRVNELLTPALCVNGAESAVNTVEHSESIH